MESPPISPTPPILGLLDPLTTLATDSAVLSIPYVLREFLAVLVPGIILTPRVPLIQE
jgi:hypothetical protein